MSGAEALVPLVGCVSMFGTLFGLIYLRSKENMALIDKGFNPRQNQKSLPKPFGNLKYGLLLMGAGIGLTIAFLLDNCLVHKTFKYADGEVREQEFEALYFALIAVGGGLGLVISYMIERKAWERVTVVEKKED